jgi:hypothetical protein
MPDEARLGASSEPLVLRNEFAIVGVEVVGEGNRRRLRLEDLRSGVSVELDALELESLAWARHLDLSPLLDPNLTRWQSGGPADHT